MTWFDLFMAGLCLFCTWHGYTLGRRDAFEDMQRAAMQDYEDYQALKLASDQE